MTAKEYLRRLGRLQLNIEKLTAEIEARRARLEAPAMPNLSEKVQSSIGGDRFADAIAHIVDAEIERQQKILAYEAERDRIVEQILDLEDARQARLLYDHYVLGKPLKDLAREYSYDYYWLCHLHGQALQTFSEKYKDRKQPQL